LRFAKETVPEEMTSPTILKTATFESVGKNSWIFLLGAVEIPARAEGTAPARAPDSTELSVEEGTQKVCCESRRSEGFKSSAAGIGVIPMEKTTSDLSVETAKGTLTAVLSAQAVNVKVPPAGTGDPLDLGVTRAIKNPFHGEEPAVSTLTSPNPCHRLIFSTAT